MNHLSQILFEPLLLKENALSRLDSRFKVIFCMLALVFNLILPGNYFQIILLAFCFLAVLSWKVKPKYIFARLFIPFLIAIFLIFIGIGNFHLALVILAGVSCLSFLSFSTAIEDILVALGSFKFPSILIEITFLMYKYIFIFFEEMDKIYYAQASRLGYLNFRNSLRSLSILVGMLIMRSFERAGSCYEAMLARGYKDKLFY